MYAVADRENCKGLIARGTTNIYLVKGNNFNVVFTNRR